MVSEPTGPGKIRQCENVRKCALTKFISTDKFISNERKLMQ